MEKDEYGHGGVSDPGGQGVGQGLVGRHDSGVDGCERVRRRPVAQGQWGQNRDKRWQNGGGVERGAAENVILRDQGLRRAGKGKGVVFEFVMCVCVFVCMCAC